MAPGVSTLAATAAAASSNKGPAAENHLLPSSALPQPHQDGGGDEEDAARSKSQKQQLECPRCRSTNTKFCYYNNYSTAQPRHFCRACRRYWTHGGTLRDVPVGGATRRAKRPRVSADDPSAASSASSPPQRSTTTDACPPEDLSTSAFPFLSDGTYFLPLLDLGMFAPPWPPSSAVAPDLYDGIAPSWDNVAGALGGDIAAGLEFSWPPPPPPLPPGN